MIKMDYSKMNDFEQVEKGVYEVVVQSAFETYTEGSGIPNINVTFIIRNDIEQKFKNHNLWKSIFKVKDINKTFNIEGYVGFQIMEICQAVGIPENTNFNSLEEILKSWVGKPLKLTLDYRDYNGRSYYDVKSLKPTEFKTVNHKYKAERQAIEGFQPRQDENIPF